MKILFCARHFGYLRNFESAIVELARRGHRVHLAADRPESAGGAQMVEALAERHEGITSGWTPERTDREWVEFATSLRKTHDLLRYADRRYDAAPKLRDRSRERTPQLGLRLVSRAARFGSAGIASLRAALDATEEAVPVPETYRAFLRQHAPDLVLFTPLVDLGSPQIDLLKAARSLGLRTVLCVGSWDHLSSKAVIRIVPDLMTVWNDVQKREAIEMHGVASDTVAVTGAQCYDRWFGRTPSRSREGFCADMGLPPDQPYLLYVCSSPFRGAPPEADFICEWIAALRASADSRLQRIGILVRPHPSRLDEWKGRDLSALGPVVLHGDNPVTEPARNDYFDALAHSAAVIGLNTSAFLEAAVAGKSVHVVLVPQQQESQGGTLHFHYLTNVGGGLVRLARSLDEHLAQIIGVLDRPPPPTVNDRFVQAFIRPHGLREPATPRFADAIEAAARRPVRPVATRGWAGTLLAPLVRRAVRPREHGRVRAGTRDLRSKA